MLPRGIRNHNPLNIRKSKDQWKGMAEVQTDRAFVSSRRAIRTVVNTMRGPAGPLISK